MADPITVDGHALLSDVAADLSSDALSAHTALAIDLLELGDLALTDGTAQMERAQRAVALQVSYQVEQGMDAAVYQRKVVGALTDEYREDFSPLHPIAEELADNLKEEQEAGRYRPVISRR